MRALSRSDPEGVLVFVRELDDVDGPVPLTTELLDRLTQLVGCNAEFRIVDSIGLRAGDRQTRSASLHFESQGRDFEERHRDLTPDRTSRRTGGGPSRAGSSPSCSPCSGATARPPGGAASSSTGQTG